MKSVPTAAELGRQPLASPGSSLAQRQACVPCPHISGGTPPASFTLAVPGDVRCAGEEIFKGMTTSKPRCDSVCKIPLGESLTTRNKFQVSGAAAWNCFHGIDPFTGMTVSGRVFIDKSQIICEEATSIRFVTLL